MKVYIVQHIGYEYDDEHYYRSQCEGGNPERIFKNKKKADKLCLELNKKEIVGLNLYEYDPDFETIEDLKDLICGNPKDYEAIVKDCSVEDIKKIMRLTRIRFYEVIEMELE